LIGVMGVKLPDSDIGKAGFLHHGKQK